MPMIRFHDIRHSAATLMLTAGVNPKVVFRDARSHERGHHPGPLLARHPDDAGGSRAADGPAALEPG